MATPTPVATSSSDFEGFKPVIVDPLSVTPSENSISCYWNTNTTGAIIFGNLRFSTGLEVEDLCSDFGQKLTLKSDRKIVISSGPMINQFNVKKVGNESVFVCLRQSVLISGSSNLLWKWSKTHSDPVHYTDFHSLSLLHSPLRCR